MKLYTETDQYKLYEGNMLDMLDVIPENSIDAIITDPPYELNFMNKGWDRSGIAFQKWTRTFHRIACAIEDAGFEIRDTIMWLVGSGFPKSMNIGKAVEAKLTTGSANTQEFKNLDGEKSVAGGWGIKKRDFEQGYRGRNYDEDEHLYTTDVNYTTEEGKRWDGWGTALKPAFEPVIVARKPCEGSTTDNVLKYGVGGINIDECRVPISKSDINLINAKSSKNPTDNYNRNESKKYGDYALNIATPANEDGRFPANIILTYDDSDFDEVCGGFPNTKSTGGSGESSASGGLGNNIYGKYNHDVVADHLGGLGDEGSAARYFYCAKASRLDRDEGLDAFAEHSTGDLQGGRKEGSAGSVMNPLRPDGHIRNNPLNPYAGAGGVKRNVHPTVKPTSLMQYLVRLVSPKGSTILDPFNGSGSTGKAVIFENRSRNADYKYIGIELSDEYLAISKARIEYAMTADMTIEEDGTVKLSKPVKQKHKTFNLFEL